jgi:uncharacterized protein (DUF1778 family)
MHIRLDTLSKQKLERAAAYAHKSLSEFVLGQALHAADELIQEHETLLLSEADWGVFLDALAPPQAERETQAGLRGIQKARPEIRNRPLGPHRHAA